MPIPRDLSLDDIECAFLCGMLHGARDPHGTYDEWLRIGLGMKSVAFHDETNAAVHAAIVRLTNADEIVADGNVAHAANVSLGAVRRIWSYEHHLDDVHNLPLVPARYAARCIVDAAAARRAKLMIAGLQTAVDEAEDRGDFTIAAMRIRELSEYLARCMVLRGTETGYANFVDGVDLERHWLVPGVLERGDRLMVIAGEGSGKSYMLRQWAMQLACGAHWLTGDRAPTGRVLVVDCENSKSEISRQLRGLEAFADAYDAHWRDRFNIVSIPAGIDLDKTRDQMQIADLIDTVRPDLLVIGPLYRIAGDDDGRGWERHARAVQHVLDQWRSDFGIALAMEAHAGKGRDETGRRALQVIGSSAWQRWPEMSLALQFDPETRGFIVGNARSGHRGERVFPPKLRRGDRMTREWSWVGDWTDAQGDLARLRAMTDNALALARDVNQLLDRTDEPF